MSKFSRKRQMDELPSRGTRFITMLQKPIHWIGLCIGIGIAEVVDIFKHWIGGKAMDWIVDHFGSIGIFLFSYKFAVLTLAIVLGWLWLVWVALREAHISRESLLVDTRGQRLTKTLVSKKWAYGFLGVFALISACLVYGAFDFYRGSFLLNTYPLGYVIFDMDTVSGAVTPSEMRRGLEAYQFDFRPVRILEDTPTHIEIELPDVLKDHKLLLSGAKIGGDRATMQQFGAGYGFGDGDTQVMATGQVLRYEGDRIVWICGFRRTHMKMPSAPR